MYICGHGGGGTASSVTRARRKALEASPPMRRAPRLARATAAGPERVLVSSTETILCASDACVCVFVHACGWWKVSPYVYPAAVSGSQRRPRRVSLSGGAPAWHVWT
jgi:hypothetical protein